MPLKEKRNPIVRNAKWLMLLLLLVVLALMFLYKKEDGRTYGEEALAGMQRITTKIIHKGGEIIRKGSVVKACATEECKQRNAAIAAKNAASSESKAGSESIAAKESAALNNNIPDESDKTASASATVVDGASATPAPNYPAYPAYPSYPPYAGFYGYGPGPAAPDATVSPGYADQHAAPEMPQPRQGMQGNIAPPAPPTPRAAPGAPEYPSYPAYPSYPSYSGKPQQGSSEAPKQQAEQRSSSSAPVVSPATPAPVAPVAVAAKAPELSKEVLKARNSVLQNRYREAELEYKKHLAAHPDDMEVYGELGNVFLLARKYPEAARNYYEAATRMVDGGFVQDVTPLLPVITQYEPLLATLLRQKIARAGQ